MTGRVALLVGTRKGLFVFESDERRARWKARGPYHKGWPIHHAALDPATPGRVLACSSNAWWGSHLFLGRDLGRVWKMAEDPLLPRAVGKLKGWWHVQPSPDGEGPMWAGVEPAALLKSTDGGESWKSVNGLNLHGTRKKWQPGGGGLILHSIVPPAKGVPMFVGISAAGVFRSDDDGATWAPANAGVKSGFLPDPEAEVGACPHKLLRSPSDPKRLWQQNHVGVFRSDDGGLKWKNVSRGLPSKFGFPLALDPRDSDRAWVAPLESDQFRAFPDGEVAVWRTDDAGKTWEKSGKGLPRENAFTMSFREGMCSDGLDPVGVYLGTASGGVFVSTDGGDSWSTVAEHLPAVLSVHAGSVG